jgi:Zn-dependent M16 (insulinase) family peptidase
MPKLNVFIPLNNKLTNIAAGSGIVGRELHDEPSRLKLYFEGNLFCSENLTQFTDKVMHASDRLITKYPTIAFTSAAKEQVVEVGTYDTDSRTLDIHTEQLSALKGWVLSHKNYTEQDWQQEFGSI